MLDATHSDDVMRTRGPVFVVLAALRDVRPGSKKEALGSRCVRSMAGQQVQAGRLHLGDDQGACQRAPRPPDLGPELLKVAEKVYAGAKFSEPPSPSLLPKPPRRWVDDESPLSRPGPERMSVHLKSLLKVHV